MSHSQFHSTRSLILRHAWLNLWDERMTTGRINQVAIFPRVCGKRLRKQPFHYPPFVHPQGIKHTAWSKLTSNQRVLQRNASFTSLRGLYTSCPNPTRTNSQTVATKQSTCFSKHNCFATDAWSVHGSSIRPCYVTNKRPSQSPCNIPCFILLRNAKQQIKQTMSRLCSEESLTLRLFGK